MTFASGHGTCGSCGSLCSYLLPGEVVPLRVELRLPVQQSGCNARFGIGGDAIFPLFVLCVAAHLQSP